MFKNFAIVGLSVALSQILVANELVLESGWNMITSPKNGYKVDVELLKQNGVSSLYGYKSDGYYSPEYIESGVGYWVKANSAIRLEIDKYESSENVTITSIMENSSVGWNLVGTPIETTKEELKSLGATAIWAYDASAKKYLEDDLIKANSGFWMKKESSEVVPIQANGKKLIMLYLLGSDLESNGNAGTNDLNEIVEGYNKLSDTQKESFEMIIAFGGAKKENWEGIKIANVKQIVEDSQDGIYGNGDNYLYKDSNANMGESKTLENFLSYSKDIATKNRIAILWDHGASYGGYGPDENFDKVMSLEEIESAFIGAGVTFDLIGFDACLMASVESAKYIKKHATYLLASEDLEPGHGWNWNHVVTNFVTKNSIVDFGKSVVDSFVDNSSHPYQDEGKTLSLVELAKLDALLNAMDSAGDILSSGISDDLTKNGVINTDSIVRDYGKKHSGDGLPISIDLKHYIETLYSSIEDREAKSKLESIKTALDDYIVYAKDDGTRPNSYGVTVAPLLKVAQNAQNSIVISDGWTNFSNSYTSLKIGDIVSPTVADINYNDSMDIERSTLRTMYDGISSNSEGISANFSDSNLYEVNVVYGLEDVKDNSFILLGELKALQNKNGKYFAPKWNKKWFALKDSKDSDNYTLMPLFLEDSFNGLVRYSVDVVHNGKDAIMELLYDENSDKFISHKIVTYTITKDGTIIYNKDSKDLKAGDKIEFYSMSFKTDENGDEDEGEWVPFGEITLGGNAEFYTKEEDLEGYNYQYFMIGYDINGNYATTNATTIK